MAGVQRYTTSYSERRSNIFILVVGDHLATERGQRLALFVHSPGSDEATYVINVKSHIAGMQGRRCNAPTWVRVAIVQWDKRRSKKKKSLAVMQLPGLGSSMVHLKRGPFSIF